MEGRNLGSKAFYILYILSHVELKKTLLEDGAIQLLRSYPGCVILSVCWLFLTPIGIALVALVSVARDGHAILAPYGLDFLFGLKGLTTLSVGVLEFATFNYDVYKAIRSTFPIWSHSLPIRIVLYLTHIGLGIGVAINHGPEFLWAAPATLHLLISIFVIIGLIRLKKTLAQGVGLLLSSCQSVGTCIAECGRGIQR
ncbi:hypothetical protein B0T26DRAFT_463946 [Lasiosphaeria miniovina]|uniref:Uncharacterized protein n=1 Tax=Lasiosphaeria miniovina TaxID=1954250 RepID=A0AA40A038_9PEZI|nr:uncharacterized protein B0T26DRAFT_463946 [Lasiosphaeria miniovina]KAK0706614.1 hypothetical protein B0T26DRAFT_463946 [Lasiosphaeria miniovina]